MIEQDEVYCEWEWSDRSDEARTSCLRTYDTTWEYCPGCGLRVREIDAEGGDDVPDVDRLLHDAEHKTSGIMMAQRMGDHAYVKEAREDRRNLVRAALALDPNMADAAWAELAPEIRALVDEARRG